MDPTNLIAAGKFRLISIARYWLSVTILMCMTVQEHN